MARVVIDSLSDPRLAPYRNIRHRDPVVDGACFIAEGRLVVERLLASELICNSLLVQPGTHDDLVQLAEQRPGTNILLLAQAQIRELVGYKFHRGVLAQGQPPGFSRLGQLQPTSARLPMIVVCGVDNPENMGGLIRTAAAFGVSRMAITPDSAHPFSRRAIRVSMAAALRMEWLEVLDPAAEIAHLSSLGYRTLATTLAPGSQPLADYQPDSRPLALVVGSEGEGLSETIAATCTDRVTIPMRRGIDSLNVNVATAIFLHRLFG